jgi:hypothetical protein
MRVGDVRRPSELLDVYWKDKDVSLIATIGEDH